MKSTIFLPKTKFLARIKSTERAALDSHLANVGDLHKFYNWQLNLQKDKKFILLDGPPYANGEPHIGHAANKILKDFIVKSKALNNYQVEYKPGWDCHGLPIELKIKKDGNSEKPLDIRYKATEIALNSIKTQMSAFKKWGVSGDWNNYYCTMKSDYVAQQLRIFADLYEKGLVYRDYKPVYWSTISKTALAESELDYNLNHKSLCAYFRYYIINFDLNQVGLSAVLPSTAKKPVHIYALIWTTTPWTLPLNNAIAFSPNLEYALIEFIKQPSKPIREVFIIAKSLIDKVQKELCYEIKIYGFIPGIFLKNLYYRSPVFSDLAMPFVAADFVNDLSGTGLVHISYAHGFDDYKIALAREDKVNCFVDKEGRYTRDLGYAFEGKQVLLEGVKTALQVYKKHVVHTHEYVHSYPYDWRSKMPVIIRCSKQWFIDVSKIGIECVNLLKKNNIRVSGGEHDQMPAMIAQLTNRPAWCISRQRVWGVPIPYLVEKSSGEVKTSGKFIRLIAELIANNVEGANLWWQIPLKNLLKEPN